MRMIRISRHRFEEEEPRDEFETSLDEDGMTGEEEAFIRGWQGDY